jgi:hypothetical protein
MKVVALAAARGEQIPSIKGSISSYGDAFARI